MNNPKITVVNNIYGETNFNTIPAAYLSFEGVIASPIKV
jgi:hypothetical protein